MIEPPRIVQTIQKQPTLSRKLNFKQQTDFVFQAKSVLFYFNSTIGGCFLLSVFYGLLQFHILNSSINFNSSLVNSGAESIFKLSRICSGFEAPIKTLVTSSSLSTHCKAI